MKSFDWMLAIVLGMAISVPAMAQMEGTVADLNQATITEVATGVDVDVLKDTAVIEWSKFDMQGQQLNFTSGLNDYSVLNKVDAGILAVIDGTIKSTSTSLPSVVSAA